MRLRTIIATAFGAGAGAGAMYLLDPSHGPDRRRELARSALDRGRRELAGATRDAGARASDRARLYAEQARRGFAEAASTADHGAAGGPVGPS